MLIKQTCREILAYIHVYREYFCAEILACRERITILVYRERLGLSCPEGRHAIQVAISKCDILFASMIRFILRFA